MVDKAQDQVREAEAQVTNLKRTLDDSTDQEEKEKVRALLADAEKELEEK